MVVAAVVAAVVAVVEEVPHSEQTLGLEQRVGLAVQVCLLVLLLLVFLHFDFAELLVDDAASRLAFAFVSRGYDEWLLLRDHILGNGRPYIDDSDSKHIVNLHSEEPGIFGLCIQLCVSIIVSYPHNVVLLGTVRHRVDTWQHASRAISAAVDVAVPAVGPILVDCFRPRVLVHLAQEVDFVSVLVLAVAEQLLGPAVALLDNASVPAVLERV